jgi:hypothetical protein
MSTQHPYPQAVSCFLLVYVETGKHFYLGVAVGFSDNPIDGPFLELLLGTHQNLCHFPHNHIV